MRIIQYIIFPFIVMMSLALFAYDTGEQFRLADRFTLGEQDKLHIECQPREDAGAGDFALDHRLIYCYFVVTRVSGAVHRFPIDDNMQYNNYSIAKD